MPTEPLDLPALLELLGFGGDELVQIASSVPGHGFATTVRALDDLPTPEATGDWWFGVNPVMRPDREPGARPNADEVSRLSAVWADLDVKDGGCPTFEVAHAIINELSAMLGVTPVALVYSGHGIQPYWAIENQPIGDEVPMDSDVLPLPRGFVRALLRRWHRLVVSVAEKHGAKVDSVFDLPRILRMPGSVNNKREPMPVMALAGDGAPLDATRLHEVLTEYDIPFTMEDAEDPGVVVLAPSEWQWAEHTCRYAKTTIANWMTETVDGRHPWLATQLVRVACFHRNGCLTQADRDEAVRALADRFRHLLTAGDKRAEHRGEIAELVAFGIQRAAGKTAAGLASEIGNHEHEPQVDDLDGLIAPDAQPAARAAAVAAVAAPRPHSRTDDGNARLLVDQHRHHLRYAPHRGEWLSWTGTHWQPCPDDGPAITAARDTISAINPAGDSDLAKWRKASLSMGRLGAMVRLASTDEAMRVSADALNADPYALNTPTGTVDLRTGVVRPCDPEDLITRVTRAGYDASATCPQWEAFLDYAFSGNTEMITFLARLVGYSACGVVSEAVLPFLFGPGKNGKTVFLETSSRVLGSYAEPAAPDLLLAGARKDESAIANLAELRFVIASEVNQKDKFDEAKVKQLTGGDTVKARHLYAKHFAFEPTWTIWLMGNHQPRVEAGGEGFWRRLKLIPFTQIVPEEKRDGTLKERLPVEEGSGILNWIIAGAIDFFTTTTLRTPEEVTAATATYAEEEDALGRFITDVCILGVDGEETKISDIYETYTRWCKTESEAPISSSLFGRELKTRYDVKQRRTSSARFYVGMVLRSRKEAEDERRQREDLYPDDPRLDDWSQR